MTASSMDYNKIKDVYEVVKNLNVNRQLMRNLFEQCKSVKEIKSGLSNKVYFEIKLIFRVYGCGEKMLQIIEKGGLVEYEKLQNRIKCNILKNK